jgi:hypothetical protein
MAVPASSGGCSAGMYVSGTSVLLNVTCSTGFLFSDWSAVNGVLGSTPVLVSNSSLFTTFTSSTDQTFISKCSLPLPAQQTQPDIFNFSSNLPNKGGISARSLNQPVAVAVAPTEKSMYLIGAIIEFFSTLLSIPLPRACTGKEGTLLRIQPTSPSESPALMVCGIRLECVWTRTIASTFRIATTIACCTFQ